MEENLKYRFSLENFPGRNCPKVNGKCSFIKFKEKICNSNDEIIYFSNILYYQIYYNNNNIFENRLLLL